MAKHETSMLGELREPYQREVHALIGEFLHFSCCEYACFIIIPFINNVIIEFFYDIIYQSLEYHI